MALLAVRHAKHTKAAMHEALSTCHTCTNFTAFSEVSAVNDMCKKIILSIGLELKLQINILV